MNKLTDEILNKCIDNELDSYELSEIKKEIADDTDALPRLKALQVVDHSLRMMEVDQAPINITEKIMHTIVTTAKAIKPKVSYFFLSIISLFSIGVLAAVTSALLTFKNENTKFVATPYADKAKQFIENNLDAFIKLFANQNVMFLSSALTLILLISAYFKFEAYKNFKNKLNRITS